MCHNCHQRGCHSCIQEEAIAKIRDRAKEILAAAEASGQKAAAEAKASGTNMPLPANEAAAIRLKLRNAISVMQEGLVERDTEVCRATSTVRPGGALPDTISPILECGWRGIARHHIANFGMRHAQSQSQAT